MGVKPLIKVQCGKETTNGSAVAADTMLLCNLDLGESDREIHIPQADHGARIPGVLQAATTRKVMADMTLEDSDGAYFEMFPIILSMALNGAVSASEQTSGQGDYLWTFAAPLTGAEDLDTFTFEKGDDTQAYEIAYCLARSVDISGDCESSEVHCSANITGDKVAQTTITPSQTEPTAHLMDAKLTRLYIDDTWASAGDSELEDVLVAFEFHLEGGAHHKHIGSSSKLAGSHGQGVIAATLTLTMERTSDVATEELHYRPAADYTPDMRVVRLCVTGDQIGSGTAASLTIDMAGVWTSWHSIGDEKEGNTLDIATLTLGDDTTSGSGSLSIAVITTTSAI